MRKKYSKKIRGKKTTRKMIKRKTTRKMIKRKTTKKRNKENLKKRKSTRKQKGGNFNEKQTNDIIHKLNEFGFDPVEVKKLMQEIQRMSTGLGGDSEQFIYQLEAYFNEDIDLNEKQENIRRFIYRLEDIFEDDIENTEYENNSNYHSESDDD
jgi:hypothetical protein